MERTRVLRQSIAAVLQRLSVALRSPRLCLRLRGCCTPSLAKRRSRASRVISRSAKRTHRNWKTSLVGSLFRGEGVLPLREKLRLSVEKKKEGKKEGKKKKGEIFENLRRTQSRARGREARISAIHTCWNPLSVAAMGQVPDIKILRSEKSAGARGGFISKEIDFRTAALNERSEGRSRIKWNIHQV